jgi:hypothetical protein
LVMGTLKSESAMNAGSYGGDGGCHLG